MPTPWLSVVVPAYNEERGIVATVEALRDCLAGRDGDFEILVVDNASEDGTVDRLEPLLDERVRVIRNDRNRGKGYSVRRGITEARGTLLLHCDADCAPSLPALPAMLELIQSADVIAGSRLASGAQVGRRQPLPRRIVGRSFQELCRRLLGLPTKDLFCGFKLWRADAAKEVFSRTRLEGWTFDAEALALACALGYRLQETGIPWEDREGSRLVMSRILVPVIRELLAARRHVRREAQRRPAAPFVIPDTADPRVAEPSESGA